MKLPAIVISLALIVAAIALTACSPERPVQVGSTAGSAVKVMLKAGHGSGVNLGNGFILTAGHVGIGTTTAKVKTDDGGTVEGEVLWSNFNPAGTGWDVALVAVDPRGFRGVEVSELSCAPNYVGQQIRIVGNPREMEFVTTWGRVGQIGAHNLAYWKSATILDATATGGVSGGPVFDEATGKVVGLLVGALGGTGYSIMVPGSAICKMLARVA